MDKLDDLQTDAITEVINIGMGLAASSLSEMVGEEIALSVPSIDFVSKEVAADYLSENSSDDMSGISQSFDGSINGDALLLFPGDKSLELVRLLLKDSVPLDVLTEMEQEALSEVGNIILNAGLSSLSNYLEADLNSGLPVHLTGTSLEILDSVHGDAKEKNDNEVVMFIRVDFGVKNFEIDGYVVFLMGIESLDKFVAVVDSHVVQINEAGSQAK